MGEWAGGAKFASREFPSGLSAAQGFEAAGEPIGDVTAFALAEAGGARPQGAGA